MCCCKMVNNFTLLWCKIFSITVQGALKSTKEKHTGIRNTVYGVLLCVIWAGNRGFALRIIALFLWLHTTLLLLYWNPLYSSVTKRINFHTSKVYFQATARCISQVLLHVFLWLHPKLLQLQLWTHRMWLSAPLTADLGGEGGMGPGALGWLSHQDRHHY